MKKVKMMLLSLALFAVVGGALAFKARYSQKFCTTNAIEVNGVFTCIDPANNQTLTCPDGHFQASKLDPNPLVVPYCSSTFDDVDGCVGNQCFTTPTSIIGD